jgi:chromosome segregation ATPase
LRETLQEIIDGLVTGTRESLSDALHSDAARLEREVQAARGGQAAAQQVLADALAALPEGGNAAAGARLGKLQAEADTLALEIRAGRARQGQLEARVQELAVELGQAQPDAARVQALEQQLRAAQATLGRTAAAAADVAAKPGTAADIEAAKADSARSQQEVEALSRTRAQAQNELAEAGARHAGLVARHASAQEELANLGRVAQENARRERQLRRLVEEARGELVRLEGENEQIQQLNRAVTAADARLHDAESALARHAEALARMREQPQLPYALSAGPGNPRLGSGLPPWQQLLLALAGGVVFAFVRLLEAAFSARSAKSLARLADELQVKALVELPVWRDPMSDPAANWRRAGLVLLGLLTAAACVVFLRVA